jgi:hypothetical protein
MKGTLLRALPVTALLAGQPRGTRNRAVINGTNGPVAGHSCEEVY